MEQIVLSDETADEFNNLKKYLKSKEIFAPDTVIISAALKLGRQSYLVEHMLIDEIKEILKRKNYV